MLRIGRWLVFDIVCDDMGLLGGRYLGNEVIEHLGSRAAVTGRFIWNEPRLSQDVILQMEEKEAPVQSRNHEHLIN